MAATSGGIKAGKAFILIEALDQTSPMLSKIERKLLQWGQKMQNLGKNIMMGSIMAFTPTIMATKVFTEFDDAMRKVEARSSGTGQQMADLREQAKKLGRETAFTAGQIGELQAKLAQGGFNRKQIFDMTEPIMLLARSAGEGFDIGQDATTAARLVSGVINSFRMEAGDAAKVADLLTATVNNSTYSLEGLLVSFQYAASTAKEFNIPLEDTLATLGSLSKLQIDPSIIGTAFRNMNLYMSSQKGRDDFNETLKQATGNTIDFLDEAGNLRTLPELLFAIGKATQTMGSAAKGDLLGHLFGIRAMVPASALMAGVNPFAELMTHFEAAEGLARRTAEKMESGTGGAWRMFMSAVEGVALAIGDALEPSLISMASKIANLLVQTASYINTNKQLIIQAILINVGFLALGITLYATGKALSVLAVIVGVIRVGFLALWTTTKLIVNGMLLLKATALMTVGTLSSLKFIVVAIGAVFKAVSLTIAFFNGALTVMSFINTAASATSVILATAILGINYAILYTVLQWAIYIAIIGAVVLAVGLLVAQFIKLDIAIIRMAQQAGSALGSFFGPILDYLGKIPGAFQEAGAAISSWFAGMVTKGKELGTTLYKTFQGVTDALMIGDTQSAWDVAIQGLTTAWYQFEDMLFESWGSFCDYFADAYTGAAAIVMTAWARVQNFMTQSLLDKESAMMKWIDILAPIGSPVWGAPGAPKPSEVIAGALGTSEFTAEEIAAEKERMDQQLKDEIAKIESDAGKSVSDRATSREKAIEERQEKIDRQKAMLQDKLQDIEDLKAYHRKEYEDKIAGSFADKAAAFGVDADKLINAENGVTAATPAKAQEAFVKGSIDAAKRAYENSERVKPEQVEDILKKQLAVMDKQLNALEELLGTLDAA